MLVSPSIISSNLPRLFDEIKQCEQAGATSFHLDVMDGHFVPNLTMGPEFVKAVRNSTKLPLEAHLMIERPDKYYKSFKEAGADILLIHYESPIDVLGLLKKLKDEGIDYGIVINPETPFENAVPFLDEAKIFLVMSVHPGFSGQKFIESVVPKIRAAREYIDSQNLSTMIEVDGGINFETGKIAVEAGCDILVSGSYIFSDDIRSRISNLKNIGRTD